MVTFGGVMRTSKDKSNCVGKRRYLTFILANKVCKKMNHKHERSVEVYRCLVCGGYHIGGL